MSKKLAEIRKKIDALDNQIHDVLMERARLIVDIAAEKRKHKMQYVQPAREAVMIRRLLARHEGALPPATIVRIWRELVGAVSLIQTGLKVSVSLEDANEDLWDMARDYFGSAVPMQKLSSALLAIASVRENESSFAVLPWPQDRQPGGADFDPWWKPLFGRDSDIKVVCALPHGHEKDKALGTHDKALVIAKAEFSESGDDCSFIALEAEPGLSRAGIVDVFKGLKLEPLGLNTIVGGEGQPNLHLVEVHSYLEEDDKRLEEIKKKFEGRVERLAVLGGYPVPAVYKK